VTGLAGGRWPEAESLAEQLALQSDGAVQLVLLYGSRLLKTSPDQHSAFDFVVIVDDYKVFYKGLAKCRQLGRPVALMHGLARILAPNVIAYVEGKGSLATAKCAVVSKKDFERALGSSPKDHFLLGRMVQRTEIVWSQSPLEGTWVRGVIDGAILGVLEWMAPYLSGDFSPEDLGKRLLEVCYQGEWRPESEGRARTVFNAQADHFALALGPALSAAAASGKVLGTNEGRYTLAAPASAADRRRWRRHFRRSKRRATMRWLKHMMTFAKWLPYVVRKAERHTGRPIKLTALEKMMPLIFLWPRAIHFMLTKKNRGVRP
tara:strand:- start:1145 stop:2101 length:957 start_codon:yes stop_codon:yes gene_type:complete